jgi:hypothetical protein
LSPIEDDAAPEGAKGALLRREGLYSSHIVEWRKARDAGALAGLAVPARPQARRDPQAEKIARLVAEKRQLEQELAKARFVVDVQAKLRTPSRGRRHDRPSRRPTRRAHRRAVCVRRRKRRCSAKHRSKPCALHADFTNPKRAAELDHDLVESSIPHVQFERRGSAVVVPPVRPVPTCQQSPPTANH